MLNSRELSTVELMRNAMCANHAWFVSYWYECSERHKLLREAVEAVKSTEKIGDLCRDLVGYSHSELKRSTKSNFEYIQTYFKDRPSPPPRISIKASSEGQIVSLFRDRTNRSIDKDNRKIEVKDDTGFYATMETGKYFFSNSIPEHVKIGYVNPRLNSECATKYHPAMKEKLISFLERMTGYARTDAEWMLDVEWMRCWSDYQGNDCVDVLSAFKSTVITPMTLFNSGLSKEFKKKFSISEEYEKTTWGFLCVDHISQGFFREKNDVHFLYFMSDLISLYLIVRANYTTHSSSFLKAVKMTE